MSLFELFMRQTKGFGGIIDGEISVRPCKLPRDLAVKFEETDV